MTYIKLSLIIASIGIVQSYNILGIFPSHIRSHSLIGHALMQELSVAGHNVTMMTPFKNPHLNITYVLLTEQLNFFESIVPSFAKLQTKNVWFRYLALIWMGNTGTEMTMMSEKMKSFLNNTDQHFDIIISTSILNDAYLGIGQHFNAPTIVLAPFGSIKWNYDYVGNPVTLSHNPHPFFDYTNRMTFSERFTNTVFHLFEKLIFDWWFLVQQERIYDMAFPDPKPTFQTVRKNVSLVLVNSHHSIHYPKSYVPNMIEVGGFNIKRNNLDPLPVDLQHIMDESTNGVIYFSFGTMIDMGKKDTEYILKMFRMLASLKQTVIWKINSNDLPKNIPKNIIIGEWFPQATILAHPNTKIFVTHGGIISLTETVYHAVPVIGVPYIADQSFNVRSAVSKGFGIHISSSDLTDLTLHDAINEILTNDSYTKNAKQWSVIYRDQQIDPMEKAIYWIEYVARHKGAPHLRSAGQDLNWWQYHSLDVLAFLLIVFAVTLYCFKLIIIRLIYCFKSKKTLQKKVKNN